jgi:tetratricopeptide (TPR) repeat protein
MGNKRDKRQARRRHHGAAQAQRRRDREQVVAQALESLGAALERLAEAASGDEVLPEAFAEMAVGLFAEDVTKLLMADADLASEHGEALGIDLPSERGRDLVGALELRLDEEPRLAWFLAGLAAGVGDLAAAERALELAYRKLEGGVADAAAHLGRLRFEDGRLGESIELAETACERFPEHDQLQALRARCMGLAAMLIALASGRADPTTRGRDRPFRGPDEDVRAPAGARRVRRL